MIWTPSLSHEVRPRSLGQASRISGVTPAAISALMVYLEGMRKALDNLTCTQESLVNYELTHSLRVF